MLKTFKQFRYPLITPRLYKDDIQKGISVLKSGQITMSKLTVNFEKAFAKYIGAKYAVMVNSGSSANLLATAASCNPIRANKFKRGDEVLIPGICWSTSLWPLVQFGLKPVFVDIDPLTLNIDINDFTIKMKQVKKFIDNGDKVKITLRFRGREMAHQDIGVTVLDRVKENTEDSCKIEAMPKLEGRQMVMILAPK